MDYSMRNTVFFAFAGWLLFDGILCIITRNYDFLTEELHEGGALCLEFILENISKMSVY